MNGNLLLTYCPHILVLTTQARYKDRAIPLFEHLKEECGLERKQYNILENPPVPQTDITVEEMNGLYYKDGNIPVQDRSRYAAAAIGCRRGHEHLLRMAFSEGWDSVLILEDDCRFKPGWERHFVKAYSEIAETEWDQLYFSGHPYPKSTSYFDKSVILVESCWYLTSVLYTRTGMSRALQVLDENPFGEIDEVFARQMHPNWESFSYLMEPQITYQCESFSTIQNKVVSPEKV